MPPTARRENILIALGVKPADFNSYGARRGNHEVMVRGTLANIRLRNQLAPGTEGGWTTHVPTGEKMFIYDASVKYQKEGTPLLIIAGKEYGSGSSRDWAAKGTLLLGVRAVIAESFERIHRSNLVGMGVLPLQFLAGQNRESLGLTGFEDLLARRHSGSRRRGGQSARARSSPTAARRPSKWWCASIRRRKPNTIATAAFCRTWCASSQPGAQAREPNRGRGRTPRGCGIFLRPDPDPRTDIRD